MSLHFWRQIIQRTAHSFTFIRLGVRRPSKISQFNLVTAGQQKIFRLQITMNHVVQMTIVEGIGHLKGVIGSTSFWESTVGGIAQMLIQLPL